METYRHLFEETYDLEQDVQSFLDHGRNMIDMYIKSKPNVPSEYNDVMYELDSVLSKLADARKEETAVFCGLFFSLNRRKLRKNTVDASLIYVII